MAAGTSNGAGLEWIGDRERKETVLLTGGPGGGMGRTPRGVQTRPRRRKPGSNLGRNWVKTDVGPFASLRWALVSTHPEQNGPFRTKWVGVLEMT